MLQIEVGAAEVRASAAGNDKFQNPNVKFTPLDS
jgi:hypothetical protein